MNALPASGLALFLFLIVAQAASVSLVPLTNGFKDPLWTPICLTLVVLSFWSMAYIIKSGLPLGILVPLLSAAIPLVSICVGTFFYHEAASAPKIVLLIGACGLIGLASAMK